MEFIDTHAHIYLEHFEVDIEKILHSAKASSVTSIFLPNIDGSSIETMLKLEKSFPDQCQALMGLHPCSVKKDFEEELKMMENWLGKRNFAGIGETGTDLYWDKSFKEQQVEALKVQINWAREIRNYTDKSISIIEGKKWEPAEYTIINYDILKNFHDPKKPKESEVLNYGFDLVIIDEAHYIQNKQAQRTKIANDICKKVGKVWLLTGTPMTSRPINYFNLLELVDSPVAYNWMAYAIRYCEGYQFNVGNRKVWNVNGAANLIELRDRTKTHVLRRLKEDILDLPEKIITPVYLRLKSRDYEQLMGEYYDWYEPTEESTSLTVQFSKLMKVRQVIAENKVKETCEIADNIIEQGKKVIIFTNFTNTLNLIKEHFGKSAVTLDGSMSKPARQHAVDQFQENEKIKVFVGNLKAAGVGITLTAAEAVIMNDLSFVPSDHAQAEDRAYRYGQKSNVSVFYPIFENSIEGIIYDILSQKKNIFETVMGDNEGKGDTLEEILNEISQRR